MGLGRDVGPLVLQFWRTLWNITESYSVKTKDFALNVLFLKKRLAVKRKAVAISRINGTNML